MTLGVRIELSLTCPHCRLPAHVGGVVEQLECPSCQKSIDLRQSWWRDNFFRALEDAAQLDPGASQSRDDDGEWHLTYSRRQPVCESCHDELPIDFVDGEIPCARCGAAAPTRRPPDWLRRLEPLIGVLVGEQTAPPPAPNAPIEAVTIHCMSCGATLPVDGRDRTVRCTFCQTDNFLPGTLWRRVHPAPVIHAWYVVLDLDPELGMLPPSGDLVGLAADQTGELVAAWGNYLDGCVAGVASGGALRWKLELLGVIAEDRFQSSHPGLVASPDGHGVVIYSPEGDRALTVDTRLHEIVTEARGDRKDGRQAWGGSGAPALLRPFHVDGSRHVAVDTDYSLIVLRDDQFNALEEHGGPPRPFLARYAANGAPQPMWPEAPPEPEPEPEPPPPPPPRGFFARLFGKAPPPPPPPPPKPRVDPWRAASWTNMPPRVLVPPEDVTITVGLDRLLYLVDTRLRHVAAYAVDGSVAACWALRPPEGTGEVEAVAVNGDGTLFALAEIGGLPNVLRAARGARLEPIIGLEAPQHQKLGSFAHFLAVANDGRIYVAAGLDSLRVFDPAGQLLWSSAAIRRAAAGSG